MEAWYPQGEPTFLYDNEPEDAAPVECTSTPDECTLDSLAPATANPKLLPEEFTGKIVELKEAMVTAGVSAVPAIGESEAAVLGRFFRAHKTIPASVQAIATDTQWRRERGIDMLSIKSPEEVLGCSMDVIEQVIPHACVGIDRMGHPIIWKHMGGQCILRKLFTVANIEALADYGAWLNEKYTRALHSAGATEWMVVIDAAGWYMSLVDSPALKFLKRTAMDDAAHYPERLCKLVVVNAPRMLAAAWRIIQQWVDHVTREKIHIISSPQQSRETLLRLVDPSQLPAQYGGTAAPLESWPQKSGV